MINSPTNKERAVWAKEALAVFTARTYSGDHPGSMDRVDLESAIVDLIVDLFHLARQHHFVLLGIVRRAWDHYENEFLDEAGQ